jgi:transposase
MVGWLVSERVTHVTIEATGVYWKPVFHALCEAERPLEVLLVNARHVKTSRAARAMPSTRCGWRN